MCGDCVQRKKSKPIKQKSCKIKRKTRKSCELVPKKKIPKHRSNYVLNQKFAIFGDRRTKRNRDRATRNRKAVEESSDDA